MCAEEECTDSITPASNQDVRGESCVPLLEHLSFDFEGDVTCDKTFRQNESMPVQDSSKQDIVTILPDGPSLV